MSRKEKVFLARALLALAVLLAVTSVAAAEGPGVMLDPPAVARLARDRSPHATVARLRVEEARALRVGASARSPLNPEITAYAGPRWYPGSTGVDVVAGVTWPFDLSSAPSKRAALADERTRLAEAEALGATRAAVAEALDLWARARGAEARVTLETERLAVDEEMVRAAEARRRAGTAGDGDVALAHVLRAQGVARKVSAEAERDALLVSLRARLGFGPGEPVSLAGALAPPPPPPLDALLAALPAQPSFVRAEAAVRVAEGDEALQRVLVVQVPRVMAGGGQEQEAFAHLGVDVPLPIYQRNQTNQAVAEARVRSATVERDGARLLVEADLRAAYVTYEGMRSAFHSLDEVIPRLADAEHLSLRSYELGQSTLLELATARRETGQTRAAHLDALVAVARARFALDALAGPLP